MRYRGRPSRTRTIAERIYYRNPNGTDTIYTYGAYGEKLATYTIAGFSGPGIQLTQQSTNVYFAGRLISAEGNLVSVDRLGSVRWGGPNNLGYQAQYPYGVEYGVGTANDREKYATYTRDAQTTLDYAVNRYYSSTWGRFLSPDPASGSINPADPRSWNRYLYSSDDPVNRYDPSGLDDAAFFGGDFGSFLGGCLLCFGGGGQVSADTGDGTGSLSLTSQDITGTQTSGFGNLIDENGNPIALPVVGDPGVTNTTVTVNGDSSPTPTDPSTMTGDVPIYGFLGLGGQILGVAGNQAAHDMWCAGLGWATQAGTSLVTAPIIPKGFSQGGITNTSISSTVLRGVRVGKAVPTPVGMPGAPPISTIFTTGSAGFWWRNTPDVGAIMARYLPYAGTALAATASYVCLGSAPPVPISRGVNGPHR